MYHKDIWDFPLFCFHQVHRQNHETIQASLVSSLRTPKERHNDPSNDFESGKVKFLRLLVHPRRIAWI